MNTILKTNRRTYHARREMKPTHRRSDGSLHSSVGGGIDIGVWMWGLILILHHTVAGS